MNKIEDDRAIIYPTLWKPTLVFGLPREFSLWLLVVSAVNSSILRFFFGSTGMTIALGIFIIAYIYGLIQTRIDPDFFSVYLTKNLKVGKTKGEINGNYYSA